MDAPAKQATDPSASMNRAPQGNARITSDQKNQLTQAQAKVQRIQKFAAKNNQQMNTIIQQQFAK